MILQNIDLKQGSFRIKIEVHEDLFILKKFLHAGDTVTGKTSRKITQNGKSERKTMVLTLQLEEVTYQAFGKRLRLSGVVRNEVKQLVSSGSYHSINLNIGEELLVHRENLSNGELLPLKNAEKYSSHFSVLLVVIERGVASIGMVSGYEFRYITNVKRDVFTKGRTETKALLHQFFAEVAEIVQPYVDTAEAIIIAGPGFTKSKFKHFLIEKYNIENLYTGNVATATRSGLYEILRRNILDKIRKENRISKETNLIENFFAHLGREDGLAVVGIEEVKIAVQYDAVKTLMLTEQKLYEKEFQEEVYELIEQTREKGGNFWIISDKHPAGKRFSRLQDIGALLRWKIDQLSLKTET